MSGSTRIEGKAAGRMRSPRLDGRRRLCDDSGMKQQLHITVGARPATAEEFAAFEAEHGPFLPPDGEG